MQLYFSILKLFINNEHIEKNKLCCHDGCVTNNFCPSNKYMRRDKKK